MKRLTLLLLVTALALSCSKYAHPVIESLVAEPDSVYPGETVALKFTALHANTNDGVSVIWESEYGKLIVSPNEGTGKPAEWVAPKRPGNYFIKLLIFDNTLEAPEAIDSVKIVVLDTTGTFIDARDGHQYKWIRIDSQIWMAENLAYLPSVGPASNTNVLGEFYVYDFEGDNVQYAKFSYNYETYGVLYQFPTPTGTCPDGWHLPENREWTFLLSYLGSDIARKLKSTTGWAIDNQGNNGNGDNSSGFNALPGGSREYKFVHGGPGSQGMCQLMGKAACFWYQNDLVFYLTDSSYDPNHGRREGSAYSVRCLSDKRIIK